MKTVLVVSSDAGGTIALLPVVRELLARCVNVHIVASGPAIQIWQEEQVPCTCDSLEDTISEVDAISFIQQHRPDMVVSGAGAYNRIEHTFRRAATILGVFCFALVDGWFTFRQRFQRESNRLITHSVPDLIGVMDKASYAEMVEEGFDPTKLVIVGAPHIEETVQFVASVSEADVDRLWASFGLQKDVHTFVFFSAPVVSQNGQDTAGVPALGYTQVTILHEIAQALSDACIQCAKSAQLIVKPHPSESGAALSQLLQTTEIPCLLDCRIIEKCKARELICLADAVLGMTSTTLLEAALCGKPTLSIQIGRDLSAYPDKYFGNRAGIASIYNSADCRLAIGQFLCAPQRLTNRSVSSVNNQAAARVVEILLANLSLSE